MYENKKWGIKLTNRTMIYQPWPVNNQGEYRTPKKKEIKKTYCISGEAIHETLLYFEKCSKKELSNNNSKKYPTNQLIKLLNNNVINDNFIIDRDKLLDKTRWYSNEYYFYFIMFTKKIIGRYDFHFGENNNEPLSGHHKVYEQGFLKNIPWGKDKEGNEIHEITSSNIEFCILILENIYNIKSDEFIWFLNMVLPEKYNINKEFFDNESIWCSLEIIDYGFEFLKIISNTADTLATDLYDVSINNVKISRILFSINKKIFFKNFMNIFRRFNDISYINISCKNNTLITSGTVKKNFFSTKYRKYFKASLLNAANALISFYKTIFHLAFNKKNVENFDLKINFDITNPEIKINIKMDSNKNYIIFIAAAAVIFSSILFSFLILLTKNTPLIMILFSAMLSFSGILSYILLKNNKELKTKIKTNYEAAQEQLEILEKTTNELINEKSLLEEKVKQRTIDLLQANEKLKELDKAKTNFFSNISHELRTPLTLIIGPVKSIISGDYGEKIDKKNDIFISIKNNSNRLLKLINGLLDFTKIESNKMMLKKEKININKLIKYYISIIKSAFVNKNIDLIFNNTSENISAHIDRDLFETAIFNILSNAYKFTDPDGKIEIDLYTENEYFLISVADTGIGIPSDKLDKIFDRFVRLDRSGTKKYEGTGIGLSLTKEIIRLHNGEIKVKSKEGFGTTVTIKLPVNSHDEECNEASHKEIKSELLIDFIDKNKKQDDTEYDNDLRNILIVEDNPEMLDFLTSILSKNYNIFTAKNGKDALKKISMLPKQDLIISDIMMPEMDGKEFFNEIKKLNNYKNIPFIYLTARADVEEKIHRLKDGAVDYIYKPFSKDELTAKIDSLLASYDTFKAALKEKLIDTLYSKEDKKRQDNFNILQLFKRKNISTREMDIIALLNEGREYKEIGVMLNISTNTVSNHIQRIYKKFNVNNKIDLINEIKKASN